MRINYLFIFIKFRSNWFPKSKRIGKILGWFFFFSIRLGISFSKIKFEKQVGKQELYSANNAVSQHV